MSLVQNADGTLSYEQSGWDKFIRGSNDEMKAYTAEYNNALKQYEEQYALQKEAQEANLQNMAFNQNLASRQQALSEESYRSGVLNQASQLQQLGINPAASMSGGGVSGAIMSGGSNVSSVPSGSASGRNPNSPQFRAKQAQQLQMLAFLTGLAKQNSDIKLQSAQADSMRKQGDAALMNAETNAKTSGSVMSLNEANAESQRIDNQIKSGNLSYLRSVGLSSQEWNTLDGLTFTNSQASNIAGSLGIIGLGNVLSSSAESSSSSTISGSALFVLLKNSTDKDFSMKDFVVALNLSGEVDSSFSGEVPYYYQRVLDQMSEYFNPDFAQMATVNHLVSVAISEGWTAKDLKDELKRTFDIKGW